MGLQSSRRGPAPPLHTGRLTASHHSGLRSVLLWHGWRSLSAWRSANSRRTAAASRESCSRSLSPSPLSVPTGTFSPGSSVQPELGVESLHARQPQETRRGVLDNRRGRRVAGGVSAELRAGVLGRSPTSADRSASKILLLAVDAS